MHTNMDTWIQSRINAPSKESRVVMTKEAWYGTIINEYGTMINE
jgi:hypothetical protein